MHMQEEQILVAKELLQKGLSILDGKSHDYSQKRNAFSNFEFTGMVLDFAEIAGVEGADLAFLSLISTKLARMIALRGRASENAQPKNETLVDTCIDIANYAALWGAYVVDCNHGLNVLPPLDTAAQSAQTPREGSAGRPYAPCAIRLDRGHVWAGDGPGKSCASSHATRRYADVIEACRGRHSGAS